MEVGDPTESGAPALFEDLKVWWQAGQMRPEFPAFYKFIISFREQHAALLSGSMVWLHNSDEAHVVSFVRHTATSELLITINLSDTPFRGTVETAGPWHETSLPRPKRRANTDEALVPETVMPATALPALSLEAFSIPHLRAHSAVERLGACLRGTWKVRQTFLAIVLVRRVMQAASILCWLEAACFPWQFSRTNCLQQTNLWSRLCVVPAVRCQLIA